jgi:hypothetical protein
MSRIWKSTSNNDTKQFNTNRINIIVLTRLHHCMYGKIYMLVYNATVVQQQQSSLTNTSTPTAILSISNNQN